MSETKWCIGDLASHYEVTAKTIYEWLRVGRIPDQLRHKTPSGRSYWLASEIMEFDVRLQNVRKCNAM